MTTRTPPWTVHFGSPANVNDNAFAVLSVALAAAEASLTVTLNGQPLMWHVANASDATVRSGLSGYTQWIAFQWDTTPVQGDVATATLSGVLPTSLPAYADALAFTKTVESIATAQGRPLSKIYLNGFSVGGMLASACTCASSSSSL